MAGWPSGRTDQTAEHRRARHPHRPQISKLHHARGVPAALQARRARSGPGQQRLLSGGSLRGADPRFVWVGRKKQRVRWRLHQGRSDREHVPAAAPMADLRRGVHQCRDEGRQENQKRPHDTETQRRGDPQGSGDQRQDRRLPP